MADGGRFWLYEKGLGEERALLIAAGRAVEMRIEREGDLRIGDMLPVKIARCLGQGRAIAIDAEGREYLADKLPTEASEGRTISAEVRRLPIAERGRAKWPLVRPIDGDGKALSDIVRGPDLYARISATGLKVEPVLAGHSDRLNEHCWDELVEVARSGEYRFDGGTLIISPTPGMTVIDVDGDLEPRALAFAAAEQVALVIRLFGLSGNIGVDFPTLDAKIDRQKIVQIFDDAMTLPCERTSVNGFGFLQIVMRREYPSLPEILAANPYKDALLSMLRKAERTSGAGVLTLRCQRKLSDYAVQNRPLLDRLSRSIGRLVTVEAAPLSLYGFDIINEQELHG